MKQDIEEEQKAKIKFYKEFYEITLDNYWELKHYFNFMLCEKYIEEETRDLMIESLDGFFDKFKQIHEDLMEALK